MKTGKMLHNEAGQAYVEMLIALPLLVLLFFAVVAFGRVMIAGVAVDQAAFAGARYGAESLSTEQAAYQAYQASAYNLEANGFDPDLAAWRFVSWGRDGIAANEVAVAVPLDDLPVMGTVLGPYVVVHQRVTFEVDRWKSRW